MSPQRLLILGVLLYIAWRLIRNLIRDKIQTEAKKQQNKTKEEPVVEDVLVEDPICHTLVPKHQAIRLRQNGKNIYFCSDACCDKFTTEKSGENE